MRGVATALVVLAVLAGLFSYLMLPGLVEDQIASRLQGALGLPTKPDVEVASDFPPELLLGRVDRVRASSDSATVGGVALAGTRVELTGVAVSVPGLITGNPAIEAQSCLLTAEQPAVSIDAGQGCMDYLGLGGG